MTVDRDNSEPEIRLTLEQSFVKVRATDRDIILFLRTLWRLLARRFCPYHIPAAIGVVLDGKREPARQRRMFSPTVNRDETRRDQPRLESSHAEKSHVDDLSQILDQDLALDKEMSVQVSLVMLFRQDVKPPLHFKQDEMELEHGETLSTTDQQVLLIVSPAMTRCGKSSGEDFDQERLLLPIKVSCDPGTRHRMTRATNPWGMLTYLNLR
ncbi:hypothetical protein GGTG_12519 [Gaeumannomyces tritici R3-111a-1]|uniref:Uncharacterized protein n=1 Tax=Gaeumannomyces tritici (strain R3-111a-1) TaxID=644352 RepID=J3PG95_GAET3|nr:hypothetical protein GGTG_12519 [Gaeumannomyces tritici R3-111a-1]EJT69635.1 hypothetical protein GGTG_12519 [Gaeumannomyces tritici R3-111a-1]